MSAGVKGYRTKVQFWQRRSEMSGWKPQHYTTDLLDITIGRDSVADVRNAILAEAQEQLRRNRSHILLKLARDKDSSAEFVYKVKKYLYDIKYHPRLREKNVKCCEYINKYYTQEKPENMSYEDWARVRITEAKVLAYLRNTVKKQHPPQYRDEIRLSRYRVSMIDMYPHVRDRFIETGLPIPYSGRFSPGLEEIDAVNDMLSIEKLYWQKRGNDLNELRIEACAEPALTEAKQCGCISSYDLELIGLEPDTPADGVGYQRKNCMCYAGKVELLTAKKQCPHKCLFGNHKCYLDGGNTNA